MPVSTVPSAGLTSPLASTVTTTATVTTLNTTTATVTTLNTPSGVLATQNGMTGIAKAWVNFNGTGTVAIRDSFNVSSITDLGVGEYQVNFTTALPNANYAIVATPGGQEGASPIEVPRRTTTPTTTAVRIIYNNGNSDSLYVSVAVFSS